MKFDTAIIGASSSGLYAAQLLAQGGQQVAVFERNAELAPSRRTLIVTPELSRVIHLPEAHVLHRIGRMAIVTAKKSVSIELREPDLIVERSRFSHLLRERAEQTGVNLYLGHRFQTIETHPMGAVIHFRTDDGETVQVIAEAVVGADGVFSNVARAVGIRREPTVPILQAEVELPKGWNPNITQCWFDADDSRFFYWLIPESDGRGVVGLVGDRQGETRYLLKRFLERNGFTPLAYQSAQVAMYHPRLRPWTKVGSVPVYLVGDAAGHVKVTTVGGTVSGLLGAKAAAHALLRNTSYACELRTLKRELDLHWLIRALMDRLDNRGYDSLVSAVTPRIQSFLSQYNRDAMAGVFWQLFLEPKLISAGLRCLVPRSPRRARYASSARLDTNGVE
ncbi:MAG: NAD(P)/FAD-dependent oxidoreductase [Nitrospirae bacterium]|nr:NAD(P)/FAD-dependent oxidoreductase [Nitrospirota bacterium]